jgi:hypothetical protein
MLSSIPASRSDAGHSEIDLRKTAPGMPAAVEVWWQAGSTRGYEFIYPNG